MMKKTGIFVLIFFILFVTLPKGGVSQQGLSDRTFQVIPDEAIRLRILANSDQEVDQALKHLVRDAVSEQITKWVEFLTDIEEARKLIKARIPEIKETVASVLEAENRMQSFDVAYGSNVTFPVKIYDSFVYPAGEYEAVLITIGEGLGANWWCVLFPPLCFLDFSNGASVAEDEVEDEETNVVVDDVEGQEEGEEDDEDEEKPVKIKFFLFEWFGWT